MLLCRATSSITVYIAKKIVSPWPAGECRSDGPPLPVSRAGIGVALMPALQRLRRGQRLYFRFRHAYLKRGFLREPAQISRPPTTAPPPLPRCNLKREFA